MKKAMGWFAVLVLLAVPAAAQIKTSPLFIIERDKNTNVVHYDARLTADGKLDPKEPVIAYWADRAEGGPREELNWIEKKMAYGFTVKPDPSVNGYKMALVACPREADHREEGEGRRPCRGGHQRPAGRPGEVAHPRLRHADGVQSPLYRGVWQRPADGRAASRKDGAEVAARDEGIGDRDSVRCICVHSQPAFRFRRDVVVSSVSVRSPPSVYPRFRRQPGPDPTGPPCGSPCNLS